jgi:tRNA-intron endonuclease
MDGTLVDGRVTVGGDARQRYFDAGSYGRPAGSGVDLARVEAAHLLYRGDLDAVDGMRFREFFLDSVQAEERFAARFLVYADFRERGFYCSPARDGWPGYDGDPLPDLTVYERGEQAGGDVAYRVLVAGERRPLPARDLAGLTLAVVDEESDVGYLTCTGDGGFDGRTEASLPTDVAATLLDDRAVCWDPPAVLYESAFYGRPVAGRDAAVVDALQLSLVEAAALADRGVVALDPARVRDRGRAVEGERFDRRLAAYRRLRDDGVVPKTGYKFGADFRTYDEVTSVDELSHSEALVRVVEPDHEFHPRDLSLDVRLAGGVRKRMVFALTDGEDVQWLTVGRLTP